MTNELPSLAPPVGYEFHADMFEHMRRKLEGMSVWRQMVWLNFTALIPLAGALLILWLPYQFYLARGAPLAATDGPSWSSVTLVATGLALLLSSIVLHELLHGIVLYLAGHSPRFFVRLGAPYATIPIGHFLTRGQYMVMALTPVVLMTSAGGLILLFLPPSLGKVLLITLLLNAAASVGDLYVAQQVWLAPPTALFAGGKDIKIFLPRNSPASGAG